MTSRLFTWLKDLLLIGVNLLLVAVVGVLIWASIRELRRDTIAVEAVETPDELVKQGLRKEVLSVLLSDRMVALAASAATDRAVRPYSDGLPKLDFSVPGTSLSVRSIVNEALESLGFEGTRISGALLTASSPSSSERRYRLILRSNKAELATIFDGQGSFDEVIERGALAVLQEHDPYTAASYLVSHGGDPEGSLGFIYRLLAKAKADEAARRRQGDTSEVPWAYLVWAYALQGQQRWEAAANKFGEANRAYLDRRPGSFGWDLALDGRGHALLQLASNDSARKLDADEARRLLRHVHDKINAKSVSALYHLGLISQNIDYDLCEAAQLFRKALDIDYRYSLALEGLGIVYLDQATRIRYDDPDPASQRKSLACLPSVLSEAELESERMLTDAIGLNPDQAPAWFQLGVLLFQQEDWEGAAAKFARAAKLNPRDAEAWRRLGEARFKLIGKQGTAAARGAGEAYCRATQLRPGPNAYEAELRKVATELKEEQVCASLQAQSTGLAQPAPSR